MPLKCPVYVSKLSPETGSNLTGVVHASLVFAGQRQIPQVVHTNPGIIGGH